MRRYAVLLLLCFHSLVFAFSSGAPAKEKSADNLPDVTLYSAPDKQFSMGFSFPDTRLPKTASGVEQYNTYHNLKRRLEHGGESDDSENNEAFNGFPDIIHDQIDALRFQLKFKF